MEPGKPDAGKPPVRFDEGREAGGHWHLASQSVASRLLYTSTHEETILKTDGRGRVRTPVEQREALLDEFERSGVSGMKFAQLAGIKYATFANWIQKRRRARHPEAERSSESGGPTSGMVAPTKPVRLFEAFVGRDATVGLQIELPGGARMRVESAGQARLAAELLRLLSVAGARPC